MSKLYTATSFSLVTIIAIYFTQFPSDQFSPLMLEQFLLCNVPHLMCLTLYMLGELDGYLWYFSLGGNGAGVEGG